MNEKQEYIQLTKKQAIAGILVFLFLVSLLQIQICLVQFQVPQKNKKVYAKKELLCKNNPDCGKGMVCVTQASPHFCMWKNHSRKLNQSCHNKIGTYRVQDECELDTFCFYGKCTRELARGEKCKNKKPRKGTGISPISDTDRKKGYCSPGTFCKSGYDYKKQTYTRVKICQAKGTQYTECYSTFECHEDYICATISGEKFRKRMSSSVPNGFCYSTWRRKLGEKCKKLYRAPGIEVPVCKKGLICKNEKCVPKKKKRKT